MLLLDEPSAGLDPINVIEMRETLRACAEDRAVLVSTHLLPEARMLCDRVIVIDHGKIFFDGRRQDQRLAHHLPRRQGDHDLGRSRRFAGGCGRHRTDRRAAGGRHVPDLAGQRHPRDLGQSELAVDHLRPREDRLAVSEFDHWTRQAAAHRSPGRSVSPHPLTPARTSRQRYRPFRRDKSG